MHPVVPNATPQCVYVPSRKAAAKANSSGDAPTIPNATAPGRSNKTPRRNPKSSKNRDFDTSTLRGFENSKLRNFETSRVQRTHKPQPTSRLGFLFLFVIGFGRKKEGGIKKQLKQLKHNNRIKNFYQSKKYHTQLITMSFLPKHLP